jgi:hypothetical protein
MRVYVVKAFNREVVANNLKQAQDQAGWARSMGYAAEIHRLDDGTVVEPMTLERGCDEWA